jgi:hypothetical protein
MTKKKGGKKRGRPHAPKSPLEREALSSEEWLQDLRMRIHRRIQDPNSIGIKATHSISNNTNNKSSATSSPSLQGTWRFLNRSKILPQPFKYTHVTTTDLPSSSDGPNKWHPVCGVNGRDKRISRGLSDGLGCADEEDTALMHPILFGSIGSSKSSKQYHHSTQGKAVDGSDLTTKELEICQQFEGTWKGGFTLPVSREHTAHVKEIFTLKIGVGPGLVALTRKKAGTGRRKGPNTTAAQAILRAAYEIKKGRRAVPVLGRGKNEYGCFTLSGRLFLDSIEGIPGAESITDSTILGIHLESDKLYDEPLQKWKVKRKINIKGMRTPPQEEEDDDRRRTKRARKLSAKLMTRVHQEEALEQEAKEDVEKKRQHRLMLEQRKQTRAALEKKRRENPNYVPSSTINRDGSRNRPKKKTRMGEHSSLVKMNSSSSSSSSSSSFSSNSSSSSSSSSSSNRYNGRKGSPGTSSPSHNFNINGPRPVSEYDLIPEGKLVATVWNPAVAAAAAAASSGRSGRSIPVTSSISTLEYRVGHVDHTGETYEGEISSGVRHGRGTCIYTNNHMYEGTWSNGKESGYGMLTDRHDTLVYEGEFAEGKIHGRGLFSFSDGSRYDGEFREGKRWGLGLYTSKEGEKGMLYNGEWRDNICSGKGFWRDGNGNSYDGDWDRNMRHGSGVHYCSNGYIYDGQWKNNVPEGRGIAIYPVSKIFFIYMIFVVVAVVVVTFLLFFLITLVLTSIFFLVFVFSFSFFQDKSKFEGVFKGGRREGRGTYHFNNGAVYEGRFRDDQIDGMGTFNMPGAVFMPKHLPIEKDSDKKKEIPTLQKSPEDIWIVPIHLAQDIGTIHFLAGFDKEGM